MAHWAEIDDTNTVLRVLVGNNDEPDEGYQWLMDNLGGKWIKTSYNGKIRKNFAGIGMTYDEERDAFIPVKPYPSWVLNETTCQWESPTPRPEELIDVPVRWNEDTLSWVAFNSNE